MTLLGILNMLWFLFWWLTITAFFYDHDKAPLPSALWRGCLLATIILFITSMLEFMLAVLLKTGGYV